jgi:hypothetical protein
MLVLQTIVVSIYDVSVVCVNALVQHSSERGGRLRWWCCKRLVDLRIVSVVCVKEQDEIGDDIIQFALKQKKKKKKPTT